MRPSPPSMRAKRRVFGIVVDAVEVAGDPAVGGDDEEDRRVGVLAVVLPGVAEADRVGQGLGVLRGSGEEVEALATRPVGRSRAGTPSP